MRNVVASRSRFSSPGHRRNQDRLNWLPHRKTEQAAIERRQRNTALPDVRAARAAILARGEAEAEAKREAEQRNLRRPFTLLAEILSGATDEQVAELASHAGRLDPASIAQIAADMMMERGRTRLRAPDIAESSSSVPASPATTIPVDPPEKPLRGRGRPRATAAT